MKILLIAIFTLISTSTHAWENVLSCDGGMFVVDRMADQRGENKFQAVFRGPVAISILQMKLAKNSDLNGIGEFIRPFILTHSHNILGGNQLAQEVQFQFENDTVHGNHYALIFFDRYGMRGDYIFSNCQFKH